MNGAWKNAGEYLGQYRLIELKKGSHDAWLEAEIIGKLKSGELQSQGRLLTLSASKKALNCDLIPGSELAPVWIAVAAIPADFWDDFIFFNGNAAWPENEFWVKNGNLSRYYGDVQIYEMDRKPTGRPQGYDWSSFHNEALSWLTDEGGLKDGQTQADFTRDMLTWCDNEWSKEPSEPTMKRQVKKALDKYNLTKDQK